MDELERKRKNAAYMREWNARNKDRVHRHSPEYQRSWYAKNKDKAKEYQNRHREKKINLGLPVYSDNILKNKKEYYQQNKESINKQNLVRQNKRVKIDVNYRLSITLRSRINSALRNHRKKSSAVRDLGCTLPQFKEYIGSQFKDGMSWDNWGRNNIPNTWQLDHIIPISRFDLTDEAQQKAAFHYTNYQPIWSYENAQKNKKTPKEYQEWLNKKNSPNNSYSFPNDIRFNFMFKEQPKYEYEDIWS